MLDVASYMSGLFLQTWGIFSCVVANNSLSKNCQDTYAVQAWCFVHGILHIAFAQCYIQNITAPTWLVKIFFLVYVACDIAGWVVLNTVDMPEREKCVLFVYSVISNTVSSFLFVVLLFLFILIPPQP